MGYKGGVGVVADYDAADALGAAIRMEGVVLFFNVLPLPWFCALCNSLAKKSHEFAIVIACKSRIRGQVLLRTKLMRRLVLVLDYTNVMQLRHDHVYVGSVRKVVRLGRKRLLRLACG